MEDPDGIWASIAQFIEQLQANICTSAEKEVVSKHLLDLAKSRKDARAAIGSHSQAIPLLVALLRSGTTTAKVNAALTLGFLCNDEDLRVKVLLGGCIPSLLALLRSGAAEAQKAAAKAICAVSHGGVADHVGMKIFVTEGVVPSLWDQLHPKHKHEKLVDDLLTGALKNLCTNTEGFWQATLEAGGVDILVRLISSGSTVSQSNASSLLAILMLASEVSCTKVLNAGAVQHLLKLLGPENEVSVRAEAAGALQALSSKLISAKKSIVDQGGIPILISSVVAPSKEFMQGLPAQALQEHAMGALVNISGGMSALVLSLGESIESFQSDIQVADIIGALAYALMDFNENSFTARSLDVVKIEGLLVRQLKSRSSQLVQERAIEALASLYGNAHLSIGLLHAEAKRMLVGLVTMASCEIQELMHLLRSMCVVNSDLWQSFRGLEGIQILISFLGLSTEQQQEHAVALLSILSIEVDDSKWAITAAGGIPPLVQLLETSSWKAKEDAALFLGNLCSHSEESLYKILASSLSLELKEEATILCSVLFENSKVRATPAASDCIQPLVELVNIDSCTVQEASVRALDNLLDDELQAELFATYGAMVLLVGLVGGTNDQLLEAIVSALVKLGKDRPLCKLDMVKAGVIDSVLEILHVAPDSLCALIVELLRILTNNSSIAKSASVAAVVEPLFLCLTRPELSTWGQHSALQALVNILEKPQALDNLQLTPSQAIEPLIVFLESPSHSVQHLGAELLSHLLSHEYFQRDITTQQAVVPLVHLAGVGIPNLQQKAINALESSSLSWPNAIADAGGIIELSKVILQVDPQPPHVLWESAALVLSNVLHYSSQYYLKVPLAVLVKLLRSGFEQTVIVSLGALIVLEKDDASSAELMAEAGAVEVLLELLRSHQCEEATARLLEALFNNIKVRDMKVSKFAISPLSQYLLDPQTRVQPARLLATLALGDLFQHDGLVRTTDAVTTCRALVSLLEDQPTEEMTMVAVCSLQNLVMHSRTNRRAVAEAGGILVVRAIKSLQNSD